MLECLHAMTSQLLQRVEWSTERSSVELSIITAATGKSELRLLELIRRLQKLCLLCRNVASAETAVGKSSDSVSRGKRLVRSLEVSL